jgi:hypothetical protein
MVDINAALSIAFAIIGAFLFIVLKFFMVKLFKGWKGMILKVIVSVVLCAASGLTWNICPALSVLLVFAVLIMGELLGFGVIYLSQSLPYVGSTVAFAFSLVAPVIIIWLVIAIIGFLLDVLSIVALFVPIFGWIADIVIVVIVLILPIIQLFVMWGAFTQQTAGLADCVLGIGRTGPIPGTGGISIGATK